MSKILKSLSRKVNKKILMVGLNAAGKTTILYRLKFGRTTKTVPTIGFNVETFEYENICFTVRETGGHIKDSWRDHAKDTYGVIFVIDCSGRHRVPEAKIFLMEMLTTDDLSHAALLVYANKLDFPKALTVDEITHHLELRSLANRKWHIQATNAISGDGIQEGFEWLRDQLKDQKQQ